MGRKKALFAFLSAPRLRLILLCTDTPAACHRHFTAGNGLLSPEYGTVLLKSLYEGGGRHPSYKEGEKHPADSQ